MPTNQLPYGEVFKIAEIIALLLFIPVYHYMLMVYKEEKKWRLLTLAFTALMISTLAAIIREIYLFNIFRLIEWIWILIASIMFAYACYYGNTQLRKSEVVE